MQKGTTYCCRYKRQVAGAIFSATTAAIMVQCVTSYLQVPLTIRDFWEDCIAYYWFLFRDLSNRFRCSRWSCCWWCSWRRRAGRWSRCCELRRIRKPWKKIKSLKSYFWAVKAALKGILGIFRRAHMDRKTNSWKKSSSVMLVRSD